VVFLEHHQLVLAVLNRIVMAVQVSQGIHYRQDQLVVLQEDHIIDQVVEK
jgi:hypothetical protein